MKYLYALLAFLLGALALLCILQLGSSDKEPASIASESGLTEVRTRQEAARIDELESQVAVLTRLVNELQLEVSNAGPEGRSVVPMTEVAPPLAGEPSPTWYLEKYVASFRNGGEGAEYFRLAVQAFLPSLLTETRDLLVSSTTNEVLRRKMVEMLGDERLRSNTMVLNMLIAQLSSARKDRLLFAVVKALAIVATDKDVPRIAAAVWNIRSQPAQHRCLRLIAKLAGNQVNQRILSLLKRAPDDATRILLLGLVSEVDQAAALEIFQFTSRSEHATRLRAAERIGHFRSDENVAFVQEWIGYEPDRKVRRILGEASQRQKAYPNWHPMQMTGRPDVPNASQDSPQAWASVVADKGHEWAELTYDRAFPANAIHIHEVCTAGGIAEVYVVEDSGRKHLVWSGTDPTTTPGVFKINFSTTSYSVRGIRIVLNTSLKSGWNEIDAVELIGPNDRAWAKSAKASDYFGELRIKGTDSTFQFR